MSGPGSVTVPTSDERRMFGGLAFLVAGNMCCGVDGDDLVVRLAPERADALLASEQGVRPMDFTGRPMRGWLFVSGEAVEEERGVAEWVGRAEQFAAGLPSK